MQTKEKDEIPETVIPMFRDAINFSWFKEESIKTLDKLNKDKSVEKLLIWEISSMKEYLWEDVLLSMSMNPFADLIRSATYLQDLVSEAAERWETEIADALDLPKNIIIYFGHTVGGYGIYMAKISS